MRILVRLIDKGIDTAIAVGIWTFIIGTTAAAWLAMYSLAEVGLWYSGLY